MSEIITLENQVLKKLSQLPNNPGVYKFFSPQKKILYIGKAKNISSRTKSYFSNIRNNSNKLKALISEASFLEITLTSNELEALLLEQHLIKEHHPKFNIQFKEAPVQTLTSHILSAPTRKIVIESLKSAEQTEDLQDTISNAWEVTNFVYETLKEKYPKETPEKLGKRSKRALDFLVAKNETFGKEFTITDWKGDHNLKKEDIIRASKEINLFQ